MRTLSLAWFLAASLAVFPAFAASSGIDTPEGLTSLPLAVQGVEGLRLDGSSSSVPNTIISGAVGIGSERPASALDVTGEVKVGNAGTACSAANNNAGALRYNKATNQMEYCASGSWAWQAIGNSSGSWCGNYSYYSSSLGSGYVPQWRCSGDTVYNAHTLRSGGLSFHGSGALFAPFSTTAYSINCPSGMALRLTTNASAVAGGCAVGHHESNGTGGGSDYCDETWSIQTATCVQD